MSIPSNVHFSKGFHLNVTFDYNETLCGTLFALNVLFKYLRIQNGTLV